MRASHWIRAVLIASVVIFGGCGGGEEGDGDFLDDLIDAFFEPSSAPPSLSIAEPTLEPSYTTTAETVKIGGWTSDENAVITWSNSAGGEGDTEPEDNLCSWFFSSCSFDWSFTVPLAVGDNRITIIASGENGDTAQTITIWRSAPAAQWSWAR